MYCWFIGYIYFLRVNNKGMKLTVIILFKRIIMGMGEDPFDTKGCKGQTWFLSSFLLALHGLLSFQSYKKLNMKHGEICQLQIGLLFFSARLCL